MMEFICCNKNSVAEWGNYGQWLIVTPLVTRLLVPVTLLPQLEEGGTALAPFLAFSCACILRASPAISSSSWRSLSIFSSVSFCEAQRKGDGEMEGERERGGGSSQVDRKMGWCGKGR